MNSVITQQSEWAALEDPVERIVCGDGMADKQDILLRKGILYASCVLSGGSDSFWEMPDSSMRSQCPGQKRDILPYPTTNIRNNSNQIRSTLKLNWHDSGKDPDELITEAVVSFLHDHPGTVSTVGGPGARAHTDKTVQYYCTNRELVFFRGGYRDCVVASMINAVQILRGGAIVRRVIMKYE